MKEAQNDVDLLSAYIDGELGSAEMVSVKSRLARDAELATLLSSLRKSDEHLRVAVHGIDAEPLPDSLVQLLSAPPVLAEPPKQTLPERQKQKPARKDVFALLAQLFGSFTAAGAYKMVPVAAAIAVITGFFFLQNASVERGPSAPEFASNTSANLNVLDKLVAGESAAVPGGLLTEVLAFRRHDGTLCKHYTYEASASDTGSEAVACLGEGVWTKVAGGEVSQASKTSAYQMASGEALPEIDLYIEANIAGSALTREEERAILDSSTSQQP